MSCTYSQYNTVNIRPIPDWDSNLTSSVREIKAIHASDPGAKDITLRYTGAYCKQTTLDAEM